MKLFIKTNTKIINLGRSCIIPKPCLSTVEMSTSLKTNLSKVLNQDACEAVLKWSEQAPKAELEVVAKFFQQVRETSQSH